MKLQYVLMGSHLLAGLAGALAVAATGVFLPVTSTIVVGSLLATLVGVVVGYLAADRLLEALVSLERAFTSGDVSRVRTVGISDIDTVSDRLRSIIHRWSEAAANSREQSREIERLVNHLNRRQASNGRKAGPASGALLRQQLASISSSATSELNQILECTKEIERHTSEISTGTSEQTEAVNKTTTYVEQMSINIDSISQNADAAQQAAVKTRDSASEALALVRELIDGMNRIRTHVEASASRIRALGDHSQEIGSIVEMIGAISSRTDMLALNASIESVRAGEHGRGFAVVAEEVRKLAEQVAQASREVGGLVESIQLETQESIALMAEERDEVEAEVGRVNAAGDALERISQISTDSASQVGAITQSTQAQLQLTQDVVLAMERISEIARSSRTRAEKTCWATQSLTKVARQFDESLSPLRQYSRVGEAEEVSVANTMPDTGYGSAGSLDPSLDPTTSVPTA